MPVRLLQCNQIGSNDGILGYQEQNIPQVAVLDAIRTQSKRDNLTFDRADIDIDPLGALYGQTALRR